MPPRSKEDAALHTVAASEGWGVARQILVRHIVSLLDLSQLDAKDAAALSVEVIARRTAAGYLQEFLNTVEGGAKQAAEQFREAKEDDVGRSIVQPE